MPPCTTYLTGNLDYVRESQLDWCICVCVYCRYVCVSVGGWGVCFIWGIWLAHWQGSQAKCWLDRYMGTSVQVSVCHVASPPRVLANSSTYWMHYRVEPVQLCAHKSVCVCVCVWVCVSTQLICARELLSCMSKSALSPWSWNAFASLRIIFNY